jgi:hypothetical protein
VSVVGLGYSIAMIRLLSRQIEPSPVRMLVDLELLLVTRRSLWLGWPADEKLTAAVADERSI